MYAFLKQPAPQPPTNPLLMPWSSRHHARIVRQLMLLAHCISMMVTWEPASLHVEW